MKLYSRHLGNGWPLVIIHGLYGSSDNWLSVAKRLEQHFSIYLIDLRNHGRSPHSSDHSYEAMALDLKELLDDLHLHKPIILGHSMGGKAAMYFGAMFPERVKRLVVVDISPLGHTQSLEKQQIVDEHRAILATLRQLPLETMSSHIEADRWLSHHIKEARLRGFLLKNLAKENGKLVWRLNLAAISYQLPNIMEGLDAHNPMHTNQRSFPILFIKGGKSEYISESDLDAIKLYYPEAQLVRVEEAGHWLHAEQPEQLIKLLLDFCSQETI